MTVLEIAQSLVDSCRAGKFAEPYGTLFAADAKSVEGTGEVANGLDEIVAKGMEFGRENDFGNPTIEGPFVNGDNFAVVFTMDITPKATGKTMSFSEIGYYTVRDGKIVEERFLFGA